MNNKQQAGFTLIELLVAVVIIGILAAIAFPSYSAQVTKSNRSDARVLMTSTVQRIQRCYSAFGRYLPAEDGQCPVIDQLTNGGISSEQGFYIAQLADDDLENQSFLLRVTPTAGGRQQDDIECAVYRTDQIGNRTALNRSGNDSSEICW